MILKFVLYPSDDNEKTQEVFVECSGFNQSYCDSPVRAGQTNHKDCAHFAITGNRGPNPRNEMVVDCKNTVVYVMNDNGKTVDKYRWSKTEDENIVRM